MGKLSKIQRSVLINTLEQAEADAEVKGESCVTIRLTREDINEIVKDMLQIEHKWHDLEEDPKDLPEPYELCQLIGYGSDFIVPQEGETLEQAILRIQQTEWHRLDSIDDEGFWDGDEGYPMMVSPRYWKRLDWSRDE